MKAKITILLNLLATIQFGSAFEDSTENPDQIEPECGFGQVWIPPRMECFPKVRLGEKCQFDAQCNRIVSYSFCGWRTDREHPICMCGDSFMPTKAGSCVPVVSCEIKDFNSAMKQGNCGQNAFCRNEACICMPNFELNQLGECISSELKTSPMTQRSTDAKLLLDLKGRLNRLTERFQKFQYFAMVIFLVNLMAISVFTMHWVLKKQRKRQFQAFKQNNLLLANENGIGQTTVY